MYLTDMAWSSGIQTKNAWSFTSSSTYIFMAWYLGNMGTTFTFIFNAARLRRLCLRAQMLIY